MPSGPHQGRLLLSLFPVDLHRAGRVALNEKKELLVLKGREKDLSVLPRCSAACKEMDGLGRARGPALIYEKSAAIVTISKQLAEPKLSQKASSALSCQGNKASFIKKRKVKPCLML